MTTTEQLERDRAAVREKWPWAACWRDRETGRYEVLERCDHMLDLSGEHDTEAAAWADAARRLKGEG